MVIISIPLRPRPQAPGQGAGRGQGVLVGQAEEKAVAMDSETVRGSDVLAGGEVGMGTDLRLRRRIA